MAGSSCLAGGDAGILGEAQGSGAVSCMEQCTRSPPWLGVVPSFCTCFRGTMDFTGVPCKERGFGLLKTPWGSEGCSQSDQASGGSWWWW